MDYIWWQVCLIQLFKGISWSIPIWSIFFAISWFMTYVTKEMVDKAKKKFTTEK